MRKISWVCSKKKTAVVFRRLPLSIRDLPFILPRFQIDPNHFTGLIFLFRFSGFLLSYDCDSTLVVDHPSHVRLLIMAYKLLNTKFEFWKTRTSITDPVSNDEQGRSFSSP